MRILITGAAGRVGSAVADHLHKVGHDVVATDVMYRSGLAFNLHLADLCDHRAIYPLVEGCDAVIHLGNHPHVGAIRPTQKLMAENVAMNANVFAAAYDVGVRRIIGISSIQATTRTHGSDVWSREANPCHWPHFPIDGWLPRDPGNNEYALSKVFAELHLEAMARQHADLAAIMVRLPWVQSPVKRAPWKIDRPLELHDRRLAEGMCYVAVEDVCTALRAMVEQMKTGYRQYFVGQSLTVRGMLLEDVVGRFLPNQKVVGPLGGDGGLVDLSSLKADFGWTPAHPPIEIELARDNPNA